MRSTRELGFLVSEVSDRPAKFPATRYEFAASFCDAYLEESVRAARTIDLSKVEHAAEMLLQAYTSGTSVFSCGNGGSAAVANHLQCDHLKGVKTGTDLLPRVISLSSNVELLTAVANDLAFEEIFAYQLQSHASPGDVLITISSSGRSPNIVRAMACAREHGVRTIALTGFSGGDAKMMADVAVHVDCENYGIIEDLHQGVMHAIAQYIRQSRMTPDAIAASTF